MSCELGVLTRAHGSCNFSQGNTQILAAVYGPQEVKQNKEQPHRALVQVTWKPKSGFPQAQHKEYEYLLQGALDTVILSDLYPRSGILIVIQVLEDDGSILSTALNAATMALVDAGVGMKQLLAGVSCCITKQKELYMDADKNEEISSKGCCFSVVNGDADPSIVSCLTTGSLSEEEYWACSKSCKSASASIASFMSITLNKKTRLTFPE
jgi:exosome complex component RRP46